MPSKLATFLSRAKGNIEDAHAVDLPKGVPHAPANPKWTLLDRPPNCAVALLGTPDGRVVLAMSMQGQWHNDDYAVPAIPNDTIPFRGSIVYRHTYDGCRKVMASYVNGAWYVKEAHDADPRTIGRVTMALDEDEYAVQIGNLARELVDSMPLGTDPEERVQATARLLLMVAKHSFSRGWHEIGYGYWGA